MTLQAAKCQPCCYIPRACQKRIEVSRVESTEVIPPLSVQYRSCYICRGVILPFGKVQYGSYCMSSGMMASLKSAVQKLLYDLTLLEIFHT